MDQFYAAIWTVFTLRLTLGLTLAHQHTDQLDRATLEAILGNVGTVISFRVGATDAPVLAHQLGAILPRDLVGLGNYEMFIKLMVGGMQGTVFSAES